ncbi:HAMP domain-containing protein [Streptomyces sp. NPDC006367]|uniref:HAMP domain-containing protein n=1 Tax=unclassified Streptomyces TaxID=2593676 RepID=UPI00339E7F09
MPLLGGVRPPIAALCLLVVALAGLTATVLGPRDHGAVPEAVLSSQRHFAEDAAVALRASIDERVTDLRRTAAAWNARRPGEPERVLSDLGRTYQKWTGTTVVDVESGEVLAAHGERIPLGWLDEDVLTGEHALAPRMVRLETGTVRLMTMAALDGKDGRRQLLIASGGLSVPAVDLGPARTMAVVTRDGEILATEGLERPGATGSGRERAELAFLRGQLSRLSGLAAERTGEHPVSAREPGSRGYPGVSGALLGDEHGGRIVTAGYASLAPSASFSFAAEGKDSAAAGLGLTVVSLLPVDRQPDAADPGRDRYGPVAAGSLVVLGAAAVAVLWAGVQRPVLRLFLESRRLARGDLSRPVAVPRWGEAARIGAALERVRVRLTGAGDGEAPGTGRGRARLGVRVPLAVAAVLLLLWCAPVGLLLHRTDGSTDVPATLVDDQRDRTGLIADRVRRALDEARTDLLPASRMIGTGDPATAGKLLTDVLETHPRYRALYVVDADGEIAARAGGDPHGWDGDADLPPVRLSGEGGRRPVIQAGVPLPGREGATLVGEVRVEFLNALLDRPGLGEVRVVDAGARTVAADHGYLAFEELPDGALRDLVRASDVRAGTARAANGLLVRDGDDVTVAAAAPFSGGGASSGLGWTVVSGQDAGRLALAAYERENRSVLLGMLGLTAAVVCLGWMYLVVVRPLRALADGAEALADGDLRTVHHPRYHDEVGAVARSLELLRRQLRARRHDQSRRPAGTLTGAGGR